MIRTTLLLSAALTATCLAQDFGDLEKRADEVAIVTVTGDTLRAVLRACSENDEDTRDALRALSGVSEVSVRSLEFHGAGVLSDDEISSARARVIPAGWPKFLTSRSREDSETVEGYWGPQGFALLTWEPGEITYIRISGFLAPKDIPALSGRFGVPDISHGLVIQPIPAAHGAPPSTSSALRPAKLNFGAMVHQIEASEGIHHLHISLFGLIKPVAFVASAGSVRALDMAVFENAPPTFASAVEKAVPPGWSRIVEVREANESTSIWLGEVNGSMRLLIANHDGSDGVLLTTKVDMEELEKSPLDWVHRSGDR